MLTNRHMVGFGSDISTLQSSCESSSEYPHWLHCTILPLFLPKSLSFLASPLQFHCCFGSSFVFLSWTAAPFTLCPSSRLLPSHPPLSHQSDIFITKVPLGHFQTQNSPVAPVSCQKELQPLTWLIKHFPTWPMTTSPYYYYASNNSIITAILFKQFRTAWNPLPLSLCMCSFFSLFWSALSTLFLMLSICLFFRHHSFSWNAELTPFRFHHYLSPKCRPLFLLPWTEWLLCS